MYSTKRTKLKPAKRLISIWRGVEQGGKSPFSLLFEPISPSSLLFEPISPSSLKFNLFFSLLPTFPPYFSLLPTFFGPFLPPPYSVPPPSIWSLRSLPSLSSLRSFQKQLTDLTIVTWIFRMHVNNKEFLSQWHLHIAVNFKT